MTTFFLFGDYTQEAAGGINARRTKKAEEIISGFGGKLHSVHALLGEHDIVMIAELPGMPEAVQVSMSLLKSTGISFSTAPAIPVADFDRLVADVG